MMNQLVVLLNLIGLLVLDTLFLADVRITQDLPASLAPGSEVRVTVEVEKGDLSGFAKLQLDLPPGLSATAIETKGASFTYADGKAKFIWMSLPSSPSFRITYTLAAAADASGSATIAGRLSYIEDNERRTYEIPTAVVDLGPSAAISESDPVVGEELVSAAGAAPILEETEDEAIEETVDGETAAATAAPPSDDTPQSGSDVTASRTITAITEEEMLVEVVVKKGSLRGFGKLQETIPAGFSALEKESEDAIFTSQDRIVKFVWLNLPAKDELRIVYKLRGIGQPAGSYEVSGSFGYLQNDETRQEPVGVSTFKIGPDALMVFEEMAIDDASMNSMDVQDVDMQVAGDDEQTEEEPVAQAPPPPAKGIDRIPAPETGVNFKVQITAAHREVGADYFRERHRYSGDFGIERHEGWIKYVTGKFPDYRAARDQREAFVRAGHRFPGPFVTAYDQGRRITVQEALMISNQQWVP